MFLKSLIESKRPCRSKGLVQPRDALCVLLTASASAAMGAGKADLKDAPPVKVQSSADGTDQLVRFWAPKDAGKDASGKPVPLLVCVHSWSTSYKGSDGMADVFENCRRRGWIFLAPDFRGPNNRPQACVSDLAVQDVLDAVAYAIAHANVDTRRIYLLGGSGGGHMSLVMAHRGPMLWAGVSSWVPITDLAEWHRFCKSKNYKYYRDIEKSCGGPPGAPGTADEYRNRSPIFWLARAKGVPIDMNAGIHDGHGGAAVPIDHTLRAFNVLAEANGHKDKQISDDDVRSMTSDAKVADHLAGPRIDEPDRQYPVLFRRQAGPVRVTLFDGGHRIDVPPALNWLAKQARSTPGTFPQPAASRKSAKTSDRDHADDEHAYSRSQGTTPAVGRNGMVAGSQPLAVQVGIEILQAGGNAVDAAVAVNAMLGLVEPMSCGIGGDLFAIVWDAGAGKLHGLNASGRSPHAISRELMRQRGYRSIPDKGPLSWSVPGCVDGWATLSKRFGKMTLEQVLAPAIGYAEEGFEVTPVIARAWREAEGFEDADARNTYAPDGRSPRSGEWFKNPRLARTYRAIAKGGRDGFYRGDLAAKIVAASKAKGGLLAMKDLQDHQCEWVEPVGTIYRGYTVWELPPNGQGIAALEMLNVLDGFDLAKMGHNSVEYLHRFIEAKKLAFADRARFYADPAFAKLPVAELISKKYAETQRKRIDPDRAADVVDAGDPKLAHGDTVYLTVVDKDRNAVSLIQSIFHNFGSKVAPGDLGFMLQNRGCSFALDNDHLNRLEPYKRPFHTIIPAFVTKDGKPWLSFGVMGGDMQPQGHVQVLCNLVDFGMNVQAAGAAPRCRHNGSSTPIGYRMTTGGTVHLERGIPEEVADGLAAKGHRIAKSSTSYGGYQAIRIDLDRGLLYGGSEPRKDGLAMGY
ncbi:MAG: gamma-glutamyltransferase [Phycisphaerae bacterium]|nr:gamma-glutamyltransferase [Phycisphaerae bacterium]